MTDLAIAKFLKERMDARTKDKIKKCKDEAEIIKVHEDAKIEFHLENWLPHAAKRANFLSFSSHPCTFTHPKSNRAKQVKDRPTSIVAKNEYRTDGLLRSGNCNVELDVIGNASSMDVFKFLSLKLSDGESILNHLQNATPKIQAEFKIKSEKFDVIRSGFLKIIKASNEERITSPKLKQIFYPVAEGEYHLLSTLTPSSLIFKLRERIDTMTFSEETKLARECKKKNESHPTGFDQLYNLTKIGYGGSQPQNVSVMNSKNSGISYLLESLPPKMYKKRITPVFTDFFNELYLPRFESSFRAYHYLLLKPENTVGIREMINDIVESIIHEVIEQSFSLKSLDAGWTHPTSINQYQKIWLDKFYIESQESEPEWINEIINQISKWFDNSYKKIMYKEAITTLEPDASIRVKRILNENINGIR